MDLNKDKVIKLWVSYCENKAEDPDMFSSFGTDTLPGYSIRINNTVSLLIEENSSFNYYSLSVLFFDYIRYKSLIIEKSEYEYLLKIWEIGLNNASKKHRDLKVKEGIGELQNLLSEF